MLTLDKLTAKCWLRSARRRRRCAADLLVNLVKDSLLNIVHIIFAHAARNSPKNGSADRASTTSTSDSRVSRSSSIPAVHGGDSATSGGGAQRSAPQRTRENGRGRAVAESVETAARKAVEPADPPAPGEKKPGYGQSAAGHILMFLVKLAKVFPSLFPPSLPTWDPAFVGIRAT